MAQIEQQYHHSDTTDEKNHPALSSVPSLPGPELDSKHYDHHQQGLPEPPLFSPPITNTTFEDAGFDRPEDLSIGSITDNKSPEDHVGYITEPRTPESIAPRLDFVPFITGEESLSVDHLDRPPPEIISKEQHAPQANEVYEEEEEEEEETSESTNDQSPGSTTAAADAEEEEEVAEQDAPLISDPVSEHKSIESAEPHLIQPIVEEKEVTKSHHQVQIPLARSKNLNSIGSMSVDEWLDIRRTEFQFAIGLFAIPWSSSVIFLRSFNLIWSLLFTQPLIQPITGVVSSMIAPSILYASLVALLISSAAQIHS
ncbi:hypothetical protein MJO28_009263 [Puccinia striiformis f. sp. tritici]|uniref:Uncharacterized protein n=1 Tax=Puccinia striiformis f. sp. tritici TaxID=168172 RepID=A0ACC0E6L4_9BASI|nr:hypothetical protein MJO28_009263 [Puccinia striiformis f. sp. tritici]